MTAEVAIFVESVLRYIRMRRGGPALFFYCAMVSAIFWNEGTVLARKTHPFSIEIFAIAYSGTGCPPGSIGYVYDPSRNLLTLNFTNYYVWLTGNPGNDVSESTCELSILMGTSPQVKVSLTKVEYLGFLDTEKKVTGELWRAYQYVGHREKSKKKTFPPGYSDNFYLVDNFTGWSACQDTIEAKLDTRILISGTASGNYYNEMIMDMAQHGTKIKVWFKTAPCQD